MSLRPLRSALSRLLSRPPTPPPVAAPLAQDETAAAEGLVAHLYAPAALADLLAALSGAGFDGEAYRAAHADLVAAFPTGHRATLHFLASVRTERRSFPIEVRGAGLAGLRALPVADQALVPGLLACLAHAATDMGPFPDVAWLQRLWPVMEAFGRVGGRPYVVAGDSHSTFYRRSTVRGDAFLVPLHVCCTGGSASGLANPASRSGYNRQLSSLASVTSYLPHGGAVPLLLQFGQVDLEFVHAFRRVRAGEAAFDPATFEAFMRAVVQGYVAFLEGAFMPGRRHQVTVLGVFPPAVGDEALRGGYVNAHIAGLEGEAEAEGLQGRLAALEWPDLVARTGLHRAFNRLLQEGVERAGFGFAAAFDALTAGGAVLDARFIPFGQGREHHLDLVPTEAVLADQVWAVLDRSPRILPSEFRARPTLAERRARSIGFEDLSEHLAPSLLPWLDRPDVDEGALTPPQAEWRRDGVATLPGFLPVALVDAYVERRLLQPERGGWAMPTPYLHVPELRALALYPPLMAMLHDLIGEPMMLHLALTGWASTERAWHQDDYLNPPFVASWYAAVWIALGDISPDCGPFEYLPGSHTWPLLRLEKVKGFLTDEEMARREPSGANDWPKYAEEYVTPAVDAQIAASGLPVRPFLGRKGDVLVWHGRLMHRGSLARVRGTERRSLILHYSGVGHRPDMPDRAVDAVTGGTYARFDHVER